MAPYRLFLTLHPDKSKNEKSQLELFPVVVAKIPEFSSVGVPLNDPYV